MRRSVHLLLFAVLAACGDDQIGQRYQAEHELWSADRLRTELPRGSATNQRTIDLARRYERIGRRFELQTVTDSAAASVQQVAGRAWLRAAEVHLECVDSLRAVAILDSLPSRFEAVSAIAAEAAWRRGRIARHYREGELALENYRWVVETIEPDPGAEGVADSVLHLPLEMLHVARPHRSSAAWEPLADWAQDYYLRHLQADSLDVRTDARRLLAEVEFERRNWAKAIRQLRILERELLRWTEQGRTFPRHEPSQIRLRQFEARVNSWSEGQGALDSLQAQFALLRDDYEDYGIAAPALWMMARAARDRGMTETTLQMLSRLRLHYSDPSVLPEAMLARGRMLERKGEWQQAYVTYRILSTEYPLSEQGLRVPLEIVDHHRRREDPVSAHQSLLRAETHYRDVIDRYPGGPQTTVACELLIDTLERMGRFEEALSETLGLSQSFSGRPRELELWRRGALLARDELKDPARSVSILDRIVQRYPSTRIGNWASQERQRLQTLLPKT